MNPFAGMALVGATLGVLLVGLHALRGRLHAELLRKLLHVLMGLVALSFPWLFSEIWPVMTLAAISTVLMLGLRQSSGLRRHLGCVVDGVERQSLGEVYFPIGVAVLFALSHRDRIGYAIPLLLLALGDAVAALVGVRYGRSHYTTDEGSKSWEGSIALLLVAFLSVHIPLLLCTNAGRAESLLIGGTMALLVMVIEAIAWGGLDNLFIPLGGFVLLRALRQVDAATLSAFLMAAFGLVAFAVVWRRRTTLSDSAALGAALIAFVAWAVGGWRWVIAPMILFSLYARLFPRTNPDGVVRTHHIGDVLQSTGVGMVWLFAASAWDRPDFLLPYTVSFAAHLAIIGVIRYDAALDDRSGVSRVLAVVAVSSVVLLVPYIALELLAGPTFPRPLLPLAVLFAPCGVLLAVASERVEAGASTHRTAAGNEAGRRRRYWLRQAGVLAGSALPLAAFAAERIVPQ